MKVNKIPSDMSKGSRFDTSGSGVLEVINYVSSKHVEVVFLNTGMRGVFRSDVVRDGRAKDYYAPRYYGVGYIGRGSHKKNKKASQVWRNMLSRCYNKDDSHYRYYGAKGVKVCDRWLDFGVFAKWFDLNYEHGKQLDKDRIGDGYLYSPETCCFLTCSENVDESQSSHFEIKSPDGEVIFGRNISKFCRDYDLSQSAICRVLSGKRGSHKGWTAVKAKRKCS